MEWNENLCNDFNLVYFYKEKSFYKIGNPLNSIYLTWTNSTIRLEFRFLQITSNFSLIPAKNAVAASFAFGLFSNAHNNVTRTLFDTATNA